jgi:hypothetical protein
MVGTGVLIVLAAFVALALAGAYTAVTALGQNAADVARDRGLAAAIPAWATPLGLIGLATVFSGIALALARIRLDIRGRRDAFAASLPRILTPGASAPSSQEV